MFRPFSQDRLDEFLRQFPVSAAGLDYLNRALAAPSRNVAGTTKNVVSSIPNPKMSMSTQSESKDGERPHILNYTFIESCIGFSTQPPTIELNYRGRNGRVVRGPYSPDCLVFDVGRGVVVEEWKPADERDKLDELYPGKYCRGADGHWGSDPIEAVLSPMGIGFALRFSDEIDSISHRNRQFLYTYLQPEAERTYLPHLEDITFRFASVPQRSLGDLIEEGADRDVIHWALATGRLHFDYGAVPLATQASAVQIFLHEATFKAWRLAVRPDGSRPVCQLVAVEQDLSAGDIFVLDGRRLTVRFIGNTSLIARAEDGSSITLNQEDLHEASRAGKLILPQRFTGPRMKSRFYTASPAALGRALHYAQVLQKLDQNDDLLAEDQYSAATIRRWRKKVREGLAKGFSPVESLIDEIDQRGFHGPHIDRTLSKDLDKGILEGLQDRLNKSKLTIYGDIEKAWKSAGRKMVAKSSFYERVKVLESPATVRSSQGHKVAYQIEPAHWILDRETPVHGEHAMAWLHLDSTLADVEIRSSLSGAILGRPWLTLAICGFTRRVMGFHLSFRPPSYVSSMMTLADVIRRTGRLPDAIIHDWGSEFKAKDFKECLMALFIERFVRPKSAPRFGSVIERMFGIATQQLIANIAGNTKARKNVRMLSPRADPSMHSGLWLLDLYLGLEEYCFGQYNSRKHPATLLSPDAKFDASLIEHGTRLHRLRRLEDVLPLILPNARGSVRALDSARGLFVNYRHYSNQLLTDRAMHGKSFLVKPCPFDPGLILAFAKGQWINCRNPLAPEMAMAPEIVRRCIYEEWSIEQQLVDAESDASRRKLIELLEKLNNRALENKEYWAEEQFRALLKTAVFPRPIYEAESPRQAARLNQMNISVGDAVQAALASPKLGQLIVANT